MFRFAQYDKIPRVIASEQRKRGNQRAMNPDTVDCHEAKASRNDTIEHHCKRSKTVDCFGQALAMTQQQQITQSHRDNESAHAAI